MSFPASLDDLVSRSEAVAAAFAQESERSADPAETYEGLLHFAGDHPLPVVIAAVTALGAALDAEAAAEFRLCGEYALADVERWNQA